MAPPPRATTPPEVLARARVNVNAALYRAKFLMPWTADGIAALQQAPTEKIDTLAVTPDFYLLYNPFFFEQYADRMGLWEFAVTFLHESLHIIFEHFPRWETYKIKLGRRREIPCAYRWNLAGDCFPPGTILGDGRLVEDPGPTTVGQGGRVDVVAPMVRPHRGELVTLNAQGGPPLSCTPEHPVFVVRRRGSRSAHPIRLLPGEWAEAKDITGADYVVTPKLPGTDDRRVLDLTPFSVGFTDVLGRAYERPNAAAASIPFDTDTAWLLGLYVAEGSGVESADLSLGAHEAETLGARAVEIARRFGYDAKVYPGRESSSISVYLGGPVLARAFHSWCGRGCESKRVPDFVLIHEDPAICRAFLDGLVAGDGYERFDDVAEYTSVGTRSVALAIGVRLLLARLDLGCWYRKDTPKAGRIIRGHVVESANPLHVVGWTWEPKLSTREMNGRFVTTTPTMWKIVPEGIAYPIRSTHREPYEGPVFNMETSDHTYVAGGLLVHNCEINSLLKDIVPVNPKLQTVISGVYNDLQASRPNADPDTLREEAIRKGTSIWGRLPKEAKYPALDDWPTNPISLPRWFWFPDMLTPPQPWRLMAEDYYPYTPQEKPPDKGGPPPPPPPPPPPWTGFKVGDRVGNRATGEEGVVTEAGPFNPGPPPSQDGVVVVVTNGVREDSRSVEDARIAKRIRDNLKKAQTEFKPCGCVVDAPDCTH